MKKDMGSYEKENTLKYTNVYWGHQDINKTPIPNLPLGLEQYKLETHSPEF